MTLIATSIGLLISFVLILGMRKKAQRDLEQELAELEEEDRALY